MIARHYRRQLPVAAHGLVAVALGADHWSPAAGGQSHATARLSVEPGESYSATPIKAASAGRVASTPAGVDGPKTCARDGPRGRAAGLRAKTKPGYRFQAWVVEPSGYPGSACQTAAFQHRYLVEVRAVAGRRTRSLRWADARTRSKVRGFRIGTSNLIRAIFARR